MTISIYLTGLSMGGYGTWNMTATNPEGSQLTFRSAAESSVLPRAPTHAVNFAADPKVTDPTPKLRGAVRVDADLDFPRRRRRDGARRRVAQDGARLCESQRQCALHGIPGVWPQCLGQGIAEPELVPWLLSQKLSH